MRQMIKGLLAALAVTTAGVAPAAACGYGSGCCSGCVSPLRDHLRAGLQLQLLKRLRHLRQRLGL